MTRAVWGMVGALTALTLAIGCGSSGNSPADAAGGAHGGAGGGAGSGGTRGGAGQAGGQSGSQPADAAAGSGGATSDGGGGSDVPADTTAADSDGASGDATAEAGDAHAAGDVVGDATSGDGADGVEVASLQSGPRCLGLAPTCGSSGDGDCCASGLVTGGPFIRDNGKNGDFSATVSDFRLDTYEISVGRFRQFVAGYPANKPAAGSGKNPNNASDPGWNPIWNGAGYLPADANALDASVKCTTAAWQNWTVGDEALPMNCIDWYEAFAFCIWDGGRLPTEAEWNYAAAGGSDQRPYPWSTSMTDMTIGDTYAVFAPDAAVYARTGSRSPAGDGRWHQADLAGNVMEWVADWRGAYPQTCVDCAYLDYTAANTLTSYRMTRGGSAGDDASFQLSSTRWYWNAPGFRTDVIGARCARSP